MGMSLLVQWVCLVLRNGMTRWDMWRSYCGEVLLPWAKFLVSIHAMWWGSIHFGHLASWSAFPDMEREKIRADGSWVPLLGFAQCPAQPAWKLEHNCKQTLIRWPLGNTHLFNAKHDVRQMMVSLLIMSYSHPHTTPFFKVSLFMSTAKQFLQAFGTCSG